MNSVHIKILGALLKPDGKSEFDFEIGEEMTVRELLSTLGYRTQHIPFIIPVVNSTLRHIDFILHDGDTVELSVHIGGG